MPRVLTIERQAAGLYTHHDPVESAPEGALLEAEECVLRRPGIIEKRPGFERTSVALAATGTSLMEFKDRILVHEGSTVKYDSTGDGDWVAYGGTNSIADPGWRMRAVEQRKSVYFNVMNGIRRVDELDGTLFRAGIGRGQIDPRGTILVSSGSGLWMPTDSQVSYRVVWSYTNANNKLLRGAPSERLVVTNDSGSARAVQLGFILPGGMPDGSFWEIYRTVLSASATTDPGDEHFLVKRVKAVSTTEETEYTSTDRLDEAFLGEPLYINATQDGPLKANDRPPAARDLAVYRGHIFYLNTQIPHHVTIKLIGTDDFTDGVSQITIKGASGITDEVITAVTTSPGVSDFVYTTGSTANAIEDTAREIVRTINRSTTSYEASYESGADDDPGIIRIARAAAVTGEGTFYVVADTTTTGDQFSPALPTGTTEDVRSDNDRVPNRLYRSKFEQGDAVPLANFDDVGNEESAGLRILAVRDSLLIFKEEGLYRLSGDSEVSFDIDLLDPSIRLQAPDTACILDNAVFALTTQGIVRVNESGSVLVGWPIQDKVRAIQRISNFKTLCHAAASEKKHEYYFWAPEAEGDTYAKVCWVYNTLTGTWAGPWRKPAKAAHVLFDTDRLWVAHAVDSWVLRDRDGGTADDYRDEDLTIDSGAIASVTTTAGITTVRLEYTYSGATLEEGWTIIQSGQPRAKVTAATLVSGTTYDLTLDGDYSGYSAASDMTLGIPVQMRVRWAPESGGIVGQAKHFTRCLVYLERDDSEHSVLGFASDEVPAEEQLQQIELTSGAKSTPLSVLIPRQHQRARTLTATFENRYAEEPVAVISRTLTVRPYSDRTAIPARQ